MDSGEEKGQMPDRVEYRKELFMDYQLRKHMYIEEPEEVIGRMENITSHNINMEELIEHISLDENHWYLDNKLNLKSADDINIAYLWLDTGYVDKYNNPLFISLINNHGCYSGKYVGNPRILSQCAKNYFYYNADDITENTKILERKYRKESANGTIKHFNCDNEVFADNDVDEINNSDIEVDVNYLATELYDKLVYKTFCSVEGLERYLKICGVRIWDLVRASQNEYYIQNKNKTKIVINTGLMNNISEDVFMIYDIHLGKGVYRAREIVKSKSDMINSGFSKEDTIMVKQLSPISFFDEGQSRLLVANYDDFDLSYDKLDHVLHERRERFPSNIQDMSDSEIVNKIILNLQFDLKILKRDPFFAKASYSGNENHKGVSWMLPLYLNSDCGCGKPELVMVIVKCGEFYEVKTVLQYDKCIEDRAVAINLYKYMW